MLYATRSIEVIRMIELFREIGTPVDRELAKAQLPGDLEMHPNSYVATLKGGEWSLNCLAIEGVDDFGWYCHNDFDPRRLNAPTLLGLNSTATLHEQLRVMLQAMREETNYHSNGIWQGENDIRVLFPNPKAISEIESRVSEWGRILDIVHLVQNSVGRHWQPDQIGFIAAGQPCEEARECFANTRFVGAQDATWIRIPRTLLATPARALPLANTMTPHRTEVVSNVRSDDMIAPIKAILKPYLSSGRPSIEVAATIAGMSRRSFQRKLASHGTTFSTLLDQCEFEMARELLEDTSISVTEIAFSLGYRDSSNFARAFRRVAGVSPREFRRNLKTLPNISNGVDTPVKAC
jgi:AraC-like DNA-binding protein